MVLVKKCRHGRGLTGEARRRAWRACGCAWSADLYVEGRRRFVNVGPDLAVAKARAAELVADRERGRLVAGPAKESCRLLAERWLERARREGKRPETIHTYAKRVQRITDFLGDLPVSRVDEGHLVRFAAAASQKLAPTNAREHYRTLRAVLGLAVEERLIDKVPNPRVRFAPQVIDRITLAEAEALIAAMGQPYRDMAELVYLTGLRVSEVMGLEAGDLDGRYLHVRRAVSGRTGMVGPTKNASSDRPVVLSVRAAQIAAARAEAGGRLFAVSYRNARAAMTRAQVKVGIRRRGRGWHQLRHAGTTLMESSGIGLRQQAARLGHGANLPRTMRYGTAPLPAPDAADALDVARQRHTSGATTTISGSR